MRSASICNAGFMTPSLRTVRPGIMKREWPGVEMVKPLRTSTWAKARLVSYFLVIFAGQKPW
jgi:hypothetical protein